MENSIDDKLPINIFITLNENNINQCNNEYASMQCKLCNLSKQTFYCRDCIRNGNFFHSKNNIQLCGAERFVEKQLRYMESKSEYNRIDLKCKKLLQKAIVMENIKTKIKHKKERIYRLHKLIDETKENLYDVKKRNDVITRTNNETKKNFPFFENNVQKLGEIVRERQSDYHMQNAKHKIIEDKLKQLKRNNIMKLIKYIFPIIQNNNVEKQNTKQDHQHDQAAGDVMGYQRTIQKTIKDRSTKTTTSLVSSSSTAASTTTTTISSGMIPSDTICALAEATHTAYVHGQWVLQNSQNDIKQQQHIIVTASLPDNGDYSIYNEWVANKKEGAHTGISVGSNTGVGGVGGGGSNSNSGIGAMGTGTTNAIAQLPSKNPAYNISAALTYATQLILIISYYLDIRLPYKMIYGDFCKKELSEQSFIRKVAKLNANILYLCYTQNVKLSQLLPNRTLENITKLLNGNISDLGRRGCVQITDGLIYGSDSQLIQDLQSADDSDDDDDTSFHNDWESLAHPLPMDIQVPAIVLQQHPQQHQQHHQALPLPVASGLVTSAVASVTSFWRGWTTGR